MKSIFASTVVAVFTTLLFLSCNKDLESHQPTSADPTVPAQVSNVTVTNGNGNATLTYTVPKDPYLLYVKAVYTITNGKQFEVKSSYYNNTLLVEGYADTLEHEVKLYSVSRSEVESAPITIKIKPLLSPIWQVYRSIQVQNAFGGYNLTASNPSRANVSIIVTNRNAFSEYEIDNDKSVYTNADSVISKIRGLDTMDKRFGFLVKDRWGNRTDTVYKNLKPLYETLLPKSGYANFSLQGDGPQWNNGETRVEYMWDNRTGWPWTSFTNQSGLQNVPHMVTFSIGSNPAKISRVYIRPYPEGARWYYLTTMKRFEIYGSISPNLSGALDNSWILLGSYTVTKPSGLPYGTDDATDIATASAGFSWEADVSAPKVRYIRIRCLENFGGGTAQSINELAVYGDAR